MRRSRIIALLFVLAAIIGVAGVVLPWGDGDRPAPDAPNKRTDRVTPPSAPKSARTIRPAAPIAQAVLQGHVVRGAAPVADARVTARDTGIFLETRTLEDGTFSFGSLPPGHYSVAAMTQGESSPLVGPIPLAPGQRRDGLVLELLQGASLSGSVQDVRSGRAVPGATVKSSSGVTITDDAGRFGLGPLPFGGTYVEASAKGYESRVQWLSLDAARDYSGLQIFLRGATSLHGRVTRMGEPVPSASVWAEKGYLAARSDQFGPVSTDENGAFELEVASGDVQLLASAAAGARVTGPRLTVAEGGTYTDLQIELGEALRAAGTLTIDGSPGEGVGLYLIDARSQQPAGSALCGAGGAFVFEGVSTGSYLVQVNAGGVVAQRGPFTVTGLEDGPWIVDVSTERTLAGRVEPPRAGVIVRWRSSEWAGALIAETLTDQLGAFSFSGVPQGRLSVEAELEGSFAQTDAQAGDEVVLRLQTSGVQGFVVDGSNRPVTDFMIRAVPMAGGVPQLQPVLNPNGEFTLVLVPGRYELLVTAAGYGENAGGAPLSVAVESGRMTSNVRITLAAEKSISGTVVALPDRLPLEGVEIRVVRGRGGQGAGFARLGVYTSDASGRFEFSGVPSNAWVTFSKEGYRSFTTHAFEIRDRWKGLIGIPKGDPPPKQPPYEGVGMQLRPQTQQGVFVAGVFDGSPAQSAGVVTNDEIVLVDGERVTGLPVDQVIQKITGPAGTTVRITFRRAGKTFDLILRRRSIQL